MGENTDFESLMDDCAYEQIGINTEEGIFEMIDTLEKLKNETAFSGFARMKERK